MSLTQKGRIAHILKPETGVSKTGNSWTKQEFVIETEEQFPKKICFTLFGDKVSLLNGFSENTEVEVAFNVESRDFNGKWYHNINAWKIDRVGVTTSSPEGFPPEYSLDDVPPERENNYNDLPF
ncbi:MAG: DUF3127 domain-containing protein [Prolixibacteraceae bacterium]|nr:DUF3127 domain-containing protein [Prolixibacteraceae bacterium]